MNDPIACLFCGSADHLSVAGTGSMTGETPPAAKGVTVFAYKTYRCEWQLLHGTIDQYGNNFEPYETAVFPTREQAEAAREGSATKNKFNGLWIPNNAPHSYCETQVRYVEVALSTPAVGGLAVKVRALDWEETDERWWGAQPFHGFCYEIRVTDRGATRVRWPENGGWTDFDGTLDEAKAVAQDDFNARILSALDRTTLPTAEGMDEAHCCPVCLKPFEPADLCATDIELGTCHAACLEGSPTVDLETGDPVDGPTPSYRYDGEKP